jgi:ribonucleotide reductase beta subunit family protein with ferritin-like domain
LEQQKSEKAIKIMPGSAATLEILNPSFREKHVESNAREEGVVAHGPRRFVRRIARIEQGKMDGTVAAVEIIARDDELLRWAPCGSLCGPS